jgi:hypothetical protein
MNSIQKYLPWTFRILVSALFLLSAVAKSYPIWAFEKQIVDLGIVDWCSAPYFSRLIIALELAVSVAILQKHFLKSFVIPGTILLLAVFCTHLAIQMVQSGAMNGNCGCFGQLIPMTPLEAFIKNILTIGMLVYLFKKVNQHEKGQNRWEVVTLIYSASAWLMFMMFPFAPCKTETTQKDIPLAFSADSLGIGTENDVVVISDSITKDTILNPEKTTSDTIKLKGKDTTSKKIINLGPTKTTSKFSMYHDFNGKKVNLDEGEKIVCLFVPGCDHCRDAAKEMVRYSKKGSWPQGYILFMNEELFKIPEFYQETGIKYPYHVIDDIPEFFKLLGNNATTPGVNYLWNGNIIKSYEGIGENQFKVEAFNNIIQSQHK